MLAGDDNDLQLGLQAASLRHEGEAIHFRHQDIGEQEIEVLAGQALQGLGSAVGGDDPVAQFLCLEIDELEDQRLIVHRQDQAPVGGAGRLRPLAGFGRAGSGGARGRRHCYNLLKR